MSKKSVRCWPATDVDKIMVAYRDREWGRPVRNDRKHFEYLLLDAFQAGLSWRTVLHKRKNFRKAFSNFNPKIIAKYSKKETKRLLKNPGIIRNKLKVGGAIKNAKAFLLIQKELGSFDKYIWQFTRNKTIDNRLKTFKNIPSRSRESDAMSDNLKKRGFTFVGTTICYAYMQAAGMVNDHLVSCPFRKRSSR